MLKVLLGSTWRRKEDKWEEKEINKTEENRSINISAAALIADFSGSHRRVERKRERKQREGLINYTKEREDRGNCVAVLFVEGEREGWRTGIIVSQALIDRREVMSEG